MRFKIFVWFHIRRRVNSSLSIRVSDSGHPLNCDIKCCTNKPYHKLHHFKPARSIRHYTLLHTPKIIHMKTLFAPACRVHKKILSKTKVSHSPLLHTFMLHTSSSTYTYNSKISSMKLDVFLLVKSETNWFKQKFELDIFTFFSMLTYSDTRPQ